MAAERKPDDTLAHSRELAEGSMWGLAGTILMKLVSFAYVIYLARAFSQENVGLFYLSISVITILGIWRDFGLPAAVSRYVPFYEGRGEGKKAKDLLRISYAVNLFSGLALSAAFWLLSDQIAAIYSNPPLADGIRLLSGYSLIYSIFSLTTNYLQSRADIKSSQIINNVQNTLKLPLTIVFFQFYGATLFSLSASFLLTYVIALAVSVPFMKKRVDDLPQDKKGLEAGEFWKEIVPFGLMLTLLSSFSIVISMSDRLILGYLGGASGSNEMIAIYSLATQLALVITIFPGSIATIFLPVISRLIGKEDHKAVRAVMETSQRWMLFISVPVAVVMVAFSGEMLAGFYGSSYRAGTATLSIFVLGLLFSVLTYTVSYALAGMRLVKIELKVAFVAGIANVLLNFLLIPYFGIEGAALASAASFLISMVMFNYYGKKFLDYRMPEATWRILLAGAATLLLVWLLKPVAALAASSLPSVGSGETQVYTSKAMYMLFIGVLTAVSFAIFAALALLAKTFEREDIALMKAAAAKAQVPKQLVLIAERIASYGVTGKTGEN